MTSARLVSGVIVLAAVLSMAYAASCLTHCSPNGDCGCTGTNCEGLHCPNGCGKPCPECGSSSGKGPNGEYGDCRYGGGVPADFEAANCPNTHSTGSPWYCGYCACNTVRGYPDLLTPCCRYDCNKCAPIPGCPKMKCDPNCIPNSTTDHKPCCDCDCDDGDPCTTDTFEGGECKHAPKCDTGEECTTRVCTDGTCGPVINVSGKSCTIGNNKCIPAICSAGTCIRNGEDVRDCAHGNPCLANKCVPEQGCEAPVADDTECDDNDSCTDKDICKAGKCKGRANGSCNFPYGTVALGAAVAGLVGVVGAGALLNRRNPQGEDEFAKVGAAGAADKRMTAATQMSSFTRGPGSRGSRASSHSSKGKRATGVSQFSGATRGAMMGLDNVSAGTRATVGTVASHASKATRSSSGSRGRSTGSRGSKGRSHASNGTRSSHGSRGSRGRK